MNKYGIKYSREEYRTEYLASDEWRTKSRFILLRDKVCLICEKNTSQDVHHLTYKNLPFEDLEKDLIGVCRKCHNKIHHWSFLEKISTLEKLKFYLVECPKYITLNEEFCLKLNNLNVNAKKRICGILKITIWDFSELIGLKISFRKFCEIKTIWYSLKDKEAPTKEDMFYRRKGKGKRYITIGRYKKY